MGDNAVPDRGTQSKLARRVVGEPDTGIPIFGFEAAAWGDKGLRRTMEDEDLICPSLCRAHPKVPKHLDFAVFGVFDGHGGSQSASFVKDQLTHELATRLLALSEEESTAYPLSDPIVMQVLKDTFSKLDSRIALEIPNCRDGSTAIVALFHGRVVYVASLGDAGAVLGQWRQNEPHGIPLSEAHKAWVIREKERIVAAGGTVENGRVNGVLEVSRSFGDLSLKRHGVLCIPTFQKFSLDPKKDKLVVLGCDGFWNAWSGLEVVKSAQALIQKELRRNAIEASPFDLELVCRQLVDHVIIDKKAQDNVTAMVVRIVPPPAGATTSSA